MITRRGVGMVISAIGVFFLASVTRVGWLHLADAVMWGMVVLGAAVPWLTVAGVSATRRVAAGRTRDTIGPVVGDEIEVEVAASASNALPRFLVTAAYDSSLTGGENRRQRVFFTHLPGGSVATGSNTIVCDARGRHEVGSLTVESAAPFGLFRRKRRVSAPFEVLVYPKWHAISHVGLLEAPRGETEGRRISRAGHQVMSARRYGAGDPMRDVHWKNTARTGRLMVKEYDSGADDGVIIAFDASKVTGEGVETTLEYAISIAASASRALVRNNHEVAIAAGGPPGPSTSDWRSIMDLLARVTPGPSKGLANAVAMMPARTRVLAIVSAADGVSVRALASLSLRGGSVSAVVLGGFGVDDEPAAAVASLRSAGVATIRCCRGAPEECVRELEAGNFSHADAVRRRPAAVPNSHAIGRAA